MPTPHDSTRKPRWFRKILIGAAIALVVLLVVGELVARFGLGLGDPPLFRADAQIEYIAVPGTYHRFGNRITYNQFSMRADDVSPTRSDPNELRVLVLGDSVVNGGNLTDQSQLATALLQDRLRKRLNRPVWVGNVSAGSWGPPNLLAYTEHFGWFDADVVIIVMSSHDAQDVPTFEPVVGVLPSYPDHAPPSALWEGVTRYLPAYLPGHGKKKPEVDPGVETDNQTVTPDNPRVQAALDALRTLIRHARDAGASVCAIQHAERAEALGDPMPGAALMLAVYDEAHVPAVNDRALFAEKLSAGDKPYRDGIHPNPTGQQILVDVMEQQVLDALQPEHD